VLIFLGVLVISSLKFTMIHLNSTVKTARFCHVKSCAVLNQNVILKSQTLYMLQRFLHLRTSNDIYNAVSGLC